MQEQAFGVSLLRGPSWGSRASDLSVYFTKRARASMLDSSSLNTSAMTAGAPQRRYCRVRLDCRPNLMTRHH